MNLIIDKELKDYIPPLSPDERSGLEHDILKTGRVIVPIETWNGVIVDGHNRYEIATKHNIPFTTTELEFDNMDQVKIYIIKNQLHRRNLSDGWKYELAQQLKDKLEKVGRDKQKQTLGGYKHQSSVLSINDKTENDTPHNTQKVMANALNWSTGKIAQADFIRKNDPETWEQVKSQEKSIGGGYKQVKKQKKQEKREKQIEQLKAEIETMDQPSGLYDVLAIDPPWAYEKRSTDITHRAANPYPSMSIEEICNIELPLKDNAIVWLWTTNAFMKEAYHVANFWELEVKTILTWVKNKMGLGDWLRGQTEHCLMCIKGKPVVELTNQTTVIYGPLREHSRKPDEFYQLVEELCPGRKIEFFARQQRNRWDIYGNETNKF